MCELAFNVPLLVSAPDNLAAIISALLQTCGRSVYLGRN